MNGTTDSVTVFAGGAGLTVTGTVTANIRELSGATDSVTVFGTVTVTASNLSIRSLSGITDSINISATTNVTDSTVLTAVTNSAAVLVKDASQQGKYSYYVRNTGSNTVTVQIQVAPLNSTAYFTNDDVSGPMAVGPGTNKVIVPAYYMNFTRLFYETSGAANTFEVFYTAKILG